MEILERLKRQSIVSPDGCWLWQGAKNSSGHGRVKYRGKMWLVHRLSAYINLGLNLDDEKQLALHKLTCPHKNCWNPNHLYTGTRSDNAVDMYKAETRNTSPMIRCSKGHEYNEENTYHYFGRQKCRQCDRDRHKEVYEKRKKCLYGGETDG